MKRVTVAITLDDYDAWASSDELRQIKNALVAAAVEEARGHRQSIATIEAKVGTVKRAK